MVNSQLEQRNILQMTSALQLFTKWDKNTEGVNVLQLFDYMDGIVSILEFEPWEDLAPFGFKPEKARVFWLPNRVNPLAFAKGPRRKFRHQNAGDEDPKTGAGALCLWYSKDPLPLSWGPSLGIEDYLFRLSRHLFAEEEFRNTGIWPGEDTPHGEPSTGSWPIISQELIERIS